MAEASRRVLFICTDNSARSIMAESLLRAAGGGRFEVYSAGSRPRGEVHRLAIATLADMQCPQTGLRSKNWYEYAGPRARGMDLILTLCDEVLGEAQPAWPGRPCMAHWGVPDPARVNGGAWQQRAAFAEVARTLKHRVDLLLALDLGSMDPMELEDCLDRIGSHVPVDPTIVRPSSGPAAHVALEERTPPRVPPAS